MLCNHKPGGCGHENVAFFGGVGVAFGDGKFVAVGAAVGGLGKMAYSTNGATWTQIDVGTSTWNDVVYGEVDGVGRWVAVGSATGGIGRMAYSPDGITWTQITVGVTGEDEWQGVAFGIFED